MAKVHARPPLLALIGWNPHIFSQFRESAIWFSLCFCLFQETKVFFPHSSWTQHTGKRKNTSRKSWGEIERNTHTTESSSLRWRWHLSHKLVKKSKTLVVNWHFQRWKVVVAWQNLKSLSDRLSGKCLWNQVLFQNPRSWVLGRYKKVTCNFNFGSCNCLWRANWGNKGDMPAG